LHASNIKFLREMVSDTLDKHKKRDTDAYKGTNDYFERGLHDFT